MLQLLRQGAVDAGVVSRFYQVNAIAPLKIIRTEVVVAPMQMHVVTAQGKNADLLQAIDQHLYRFKGDPNSVYHQASSRWLAEPERLNWKEIWPLLITAALVGLSVSALIIFLWNRSLRREIRERRQVEVRSEAIANNLPGVIIRFRRPPNGLAELVYISSGVSEIWDLDAAIVLAAPEQLWATVPPADFAAFQQALQTVEQSPQLFKQEWRITLPSGRTKWVQIRGRPQPPEPDGTVFWNGVILEITQLKQTQAVLQTSEEQLRSALEITRIGIWNWDLATNQVEWNDNHFRLLGYEPQAFTPSYDRWQQALHPDDLRRVKAALTVALQTQSEYYEEYRIVRADGEVRWVLGHGRGVQSNSGRVMRMLGVMLDITERKATEAALRQSEATNRQVLQAIPDLLIWMKADGTCVGFAKGSNLADLFGTQDGVGHNQYDVLPPELAMQRRRAIAAAAQTGKVQIYEQQLNVENSVQYEEVRIVAVGDDLFLVIVRNITDRKQAELALATSEQRYRLVTENMTDLVSLHYPDGRYLYISPSCQPLLGYSQAELTGQNPYDFFHPKDVEKIRQAHTTALTGEPALATYRMRRQQGSYIWLETLTTPIFDDGGKLLHLQTTSREVSDRVAMEQQLRHYALHDVLTGLPNRLLLMKRLKLCLQQVCRQRDFQFAVLFIDFDRFKVVNDSLGHAVGDQLLRAIAHKFAQCIRETDLVARLGGDEFVILLEDIASQAVAIQLAKRLLKDLRSPITIKQHTIFMTASIGVVAGSARYTKAENLIRDADIAMYQAKAQGRSSYAVFDPVMHQQVVKRLQLENDLRHAIDRQEFFLVYQPIISLRTLEIAGFEALLRWQHPRQGIILPDQFIAILEDTDLIIPLGEWILQQACEQFAAWHAQDLIGNHHKLSVNLSVKQLQEAIFIPQLDRVLAQTQIPAGNLTLEITESLLVQNIEATSDLLNQLQARGIKISIDDFGTGYSSLSYLHQLPVDSLKIDRTFISPTEATMRSQAIAESIVGLSNLLELNAIAEGIETPEQLQWLQFLNCEYGQGFLFSHAVNAEQATILLRDTVPQ